MVYLLLSMRKDGITLYTDLIIVEAFLKFFFLACKRRCFLFLPKNLIFI